MYPTAKKWLHAILFIFFFSFLKTHAQDYSTDIRLSAGWLHTEIKDIQAIVFETEWHIPFSNYFAGSLSWQFAQGKNMRFELFSRWQGQARLLFSPMGRNRSWNLRFGPGVYWGKMNTSLLSDARISQLIFPLENYSDPIRGWQIIVEGNTQVTELMSVGLRYLLQYDGSELLAFVTGIKL